jgi:hypothetical protein
LTRHHELRLKTDDLTKPEDIFEDFGTVRLPKNIPPVEDGLFDEVLRAYGKLLSLEAKHHLQRGDSRAALAAFAAALSLNPASPGINAAIGKIFADGGHHLTAAAIRQRTRMLREKAVEDPRPSPTSSGDNGD